MGVSDLFKEELNDTVNIIKSRSLSYTPEWNFDTNQPDIGAVLAILFAGMMEDTQERFRRLPEIYQMQFYNLLGINLLPAKEAKGYVTFSTVNEDVRGTWVEKGETLLGKTEQDETTYYETGEAVYVSPARLNRVYYVNGGMDYISQPLEFPIKIQQGTNRQSHIFYIGQDILFFIKTDGEIILDFHLYGNIYRKELENLLMNRITWSYYSNEGFVEFPGFRYEEGRIYLRKDKTMPAFERKLIQGKNSFWVRMETKNINPQSSIIFPKLSLGGCGSYLVPEIVYDGNMELDKENFLPFGEYPYPYAELYISSEEVFSKKKALIKLDFELDFSEYPGELKSPELPVKWHNIMHRSEFKEPEPVDIVIDSVIWEYYNGFGWTKIPDTKCYEIMFQDKTAEKNISVNFICPEDIHPFLLSARESYCIRIRIARMANLYAMDGVYIVPRIKNLMMHYRYPKNDVQPEYAYSVNQLKAEELKCSQKFQPFYNFFPDNEMIYLSFSRPLQEDGIRLLFVLKQGGQHSRNRYEYYGKDGWKLLGVEDETIHFSKSGIVTICQEHPFVKQEFFGFPGYWIRIIKEKTGEKNESGGFPLITGIYINSTIAYAQKGSGKKGNLPAGAIVNMKRSIGFINKVTNYEAITGGYDEETDQQAVKRMAAFLRHQERAVTARDFEDIVLNEVRNILQVRCFPGRDENGEKKSGHITLAVLPKKEERRYFEYIKEEIYQCLIPHMDQRIYEEDRLHIVEPEWVLMKFYMTVMIKDSVKQYHIREKIKQRINAFMDPMTGNFNGAGWQIGNLPTVSQIENICSQMEEILYVKNISLKDGNHMGSYVLGFGTEHEIEMIPE